MTPLTAAQVAKARKSWDSLQAIDSPTSQALGVAFWGSKWGEKLLAAAEVLTSLQDYCRTNDSLIAIKARPLPARDPDT
jgi:hypothetical protein